MSFILICLLPPEESPDGLVGPEYVARLLGITVDSVRRGKAGTKDIPRYPDKPLRFRRKDVHAFLNKKMEKQKTAKERAHEMWNRKPQPRKQKVA